MKEHLPRVYWRDVAPEDSRLLSGEKNAPAGADWSEFLPLADAWLDGLGVLDETTYGDAGPGPRAGTLTGPVTETLREIEVPALLSVRECDQPAVSRLVALNPAARRSVLVPEGTVFLGGAQNRLIQQPVLVPPGLHELPVFCVEMGRWDPEAPAFDALGSLPVLLTHQIGARPGAASDAQATVWELVYESLMLLGQLNPTLNVNGWQTETGAEHDAPVARASAVPNWRGLYSIDPEIGLGLFSLAPHDAFGGRTLEAVRRERDWRGCLLANARGAREFFRIFDESKKLAIRCLPDGRPLRDIRKRPILFEFGENDLEQSFRPPLERPPGPPPLSFAGEEHFGGFEEFLGAIRASRIRLTRADAPDTFFLELRHPGLALRGAGLVYKNELASLDVTAFRPFANDGVAR